MVRPRRQRQLQLPTKLPRRRTRRDLNAVKVSKELGLPRPDYTERAKASFAMRVHWITGLALLRGETCGTCGKCSQKSRGSRYVYKCRLRDTNSARTDVRLKWPACEAWESKEFKPA
jgi:hypothetical protein